MKITRKNLENIIKEEIEILLTEIADKPPLPKSFEKLLVRLPILGKMIKTNTLMQVAKKAYEEKGIEAMLKAIANDAVSLIPIVGSIITAYKVSQEMVDTMKKYVDYEKGIKNTLKGQPLDINKINSAVSSDKQKDFTRRLAMSLTN